MSTTKTPNQHSRIPSRRDQEIFHRVVVRCELQCQVAKDLGLSPGRISQILTRVRHWLARGAGFQPAAPWGAGSQSAIRNPKSAMDSESAFSALERQRLQRQLAQSRQEYLYQLCIREIHRMSENPKQSTTRVESKPTDADSDCQSEIRNPQSEMASQSAIENPKSEICNLKSEITKIVTTTRDLPLNVQWIKVAQRSAIELQKLAELDPLPPPEISEQEDRRALAEDLVTDLLDNAVSDHKVRSVGCERTLVEDLFKFLLGEPHRGLATNIIAADAEHGRCRPGENDYPGQDPMLVNNPNNPGSGVFGGKPSSHDEMHLPPKTPDPLHTAMTQPAASANSVPGSALGPQDPEAPASEEMAKDSGTAALNITKPHPASAKQPNASQPNRTPAPTPAPVSTSAHPPRAPLPLGTTDLPLENSQNFSAPKPVSEPIRLPPSAGNGPVIVIHPQPRQHNY